MWSLHQQSMSTRNRTFSTISIVCILPLVTDSFSLCSTLLTGWVPTLLRAGRGMTLWENSVKEPPPRKLELFSYENNPVSIDTSEVTRFTFSIV